MRKITKLLSLLCAVSLVSTAAIGRNAGEETQSAVREKSSVLAMTAIPDGNYLVNLQIRGEGPVHKLNIEAKGGRLKCVNSDEPRLADWKGASMLIGNGVFMVQLAGSSERATQFWVFNADGSASVKEVPDRGEKQTAVPVKEQGSKSPDALERRIR